MTAQDRRLAGWRLRYPSVADLEPLAKRRIPYFSYDFLQGGTGRELSRPRNMAALAAIEIISRHGLDVSDVDISAELFGRRYACPVVVGPVGMDGAIWPGATRHLAETARDSNIPYMTGTLATGTLESVAEIAPENFWFQLYGMPSEDHRVSLDLVRRAKDAGAHILAVTLDVPIPPRRVRDMRNRLGTPLRLTPRMVTGMLARPRWLKALAREGLPRFANMTSYCREGASKTELDTFVAKGRAGSMTWETLARIREAWPRALVAKGIQHPADAEKALSLGLDGVIVSNHGGRQFDASPATIDLVPAIRQVVGERMQVLMDGGIMSGTDVLKALACGADAVVVGRAFMLGLAALGADGARHVARTLEDELRIAIGQSGACNRAGVANLMIRHHSAWKMDGPAGGPRNKNDKLEELGQ